MRCEHCHGTYAKKRPSQRFCSPKCRYEDWAARNRARFPDPTTATDQEIRDALRQYLRKAWASGRIKVNEADPRFRLRLRKDDDE